MIYALCLYSFIMYHCMYEYVSCIILAIMYYVRKYSFGFLVDVSTCRSGEDNIIKVMLLHLCVFMCTICVLYCTFICVFINV